MPLLGSSIAFAIIFMVDLGGCMIPLIFRRKSGVESRRNKVFPLVLAFGTGAMLSIGTIHLLAEAVDNPALNVEVLGYKFNLYWYLLAFFFVTFTLMHGQACGH